MKYYYYVNWGGGIFDIGWTYDSIDFSDSEKVVKVFTIDTPTTKGWIETPLSDVYEKRQDFMKTNNRRHSRIEEILN